MSIGECIIALHVILYILNNSVFYFIVLQVCG